MKGRVAMMVAALWWGSLTTLGFLVVPMLFAHLPTLAQAGGMAAKLFSAHTWVSLACGMLLLVIFRSTEDDSAVKSTSSEVGLAAAAMLVALLVEFGIAPRIVAREHLKLWHSAGSALYGLQWICTGLLLWRLARHRTP